MKKSILTTLLLLVSMTLPFAGVTCTTETGIVDSGELTPQKYPFESEGGLLKVTCLNKEVDTLKLIQ